MAADPENDRPRWTALGRYHVPPPWWDASGLNRPFTGARPDTTITFGPTPLRRGVRIMGRHPTAVNDPRGRARPGASWRMALVATNVRRSIIGGSLSEHKEPDHDIADGQANPHRVLHQQDVEWDDELGHRTPVKARPNWPEILLNQGTVRHISELESELGKQLFFRRGRRRVVAVTEASRVFEHFAERTVSAELAGRVACHSLRVLVA
jgi:hypothetical protein